ncbi:MAG: hypothetical protein AAF941_05070 [Pseudomonadota bacterium]
MLDLDIQQLLRSADVSQINFQMAGLTVNGQGYRQVSDCLSDRPMRHRLRVTVNPAIVGHQALASYDPEDDKLNVRSSDILGTPQGRAQVVHECTHAQCDLRRRSSAILDEEGAAFVAEGWYLLAIGEDISDPVFNLSTNVQQIVRDVYRRAQQASAGQQVRIIGQQRNNLRGFMRRGYGYGSGHYRSDGIRGQRFRP